MNNDLGAQLLKAKSQAAESMKELADVKQLAHKLKKETKGMAKVIECYEELLKKLGD
jgi:hypothetical protein